MAPTVDSETTQAALESGCSTVVVQEASDRSARATAKPTPAGKGGYYRRGTSHHSKQETAPAPTKQESSTFSSLLGLSKR